MDNNLQDGSILLQGCFVDIRAGETGDPSNTRDVNGFSSTTLKNGPEKIAIQLPVINLAYKKIDSKSCEDDSMRSRLQSGDETKLVSD